MRKICFGTNISANNGKMTNLTNRSNVKTDLQKVYRLPSRLTDINKCFKDCKNLVSLEAEIPDSVKYMSSSFEGCEKFYKNISIPEECVDITKGFKGSGIKGTMIIPKNVENMKESFENSQVEIVNFITRNDDNDVMKDMSNSFKNCKQLLIVEGNLPSTIINASYAFSNSGIKEVNFIKDDTNINRGDYLFSNCLNLEKINNDINGLNLASIFSNCINLKSAKSINGNVLDSSFINCKNLEIVENVYSNTFGFMFYGCLNLKSIGTIGGNLKFLNTFYKCDSYSNIIHLNPNSDETGEIYLSVSDTDQDFLNSHPLKINGTGHGIENELNFQNAHLDKGDYISGYCNPDDYDKTVFYESDGTYNGESFIYKGTLKDVVLRPYYRSNLLDSSTITRIQFNDAFKDKTLNNVYVIKDKIMQNSFKNSTINNFLGFDISAIEGSSFLNSKINNLNIQTDKEKFNILSNAFNSAVVREDFIIPSKIYNINQNAFYNSDIHFEFADDCFLNLIAATAFKNSKNITFKENSIRKVTYIGNNAFNNVSISKLNIPDGITIWGDAFYNTPITNLELPDSVILKDRSLQGMKKLTDLNIYHFNSSYFDSTEPPQLKNITLRNSQSIANLRLINSYVKVINLPHGIIGGSIADDQFKDFKKLTNFYTIGTPHIGKNAFNGCFNLLNISDVGNVNTDAFNGCSKLFKLNANTVQAGALNGCDGLYSLKATINNYDCGFPYINNCHYIGFLWNSDSKELSKKDTPETREGFRRFDFISPSNSLNTIYLYLPELNELRDVNINLCTTNKNTVKDSHNMFNGMSYLQNITFSYWWDDDLYNVVDGCTGLINYNIEGRREGYDNIPVSHLINDISLSSIQNINFHFSNYNINASVRNDFYDFCNVLKKCKNLNNVDFGTKCFNNDISMKFNGLSFYNYSSSITILPDVYNGKSRSGNQYLHSQFESSFTVPTKKIGVKTHPKDTDYYGIPNYNMSLTDKDIYFGDAVDIDKNFFVNRENLNVYVSNIKTTHNLYFNNSSNITIYYSDLTHVPNIHTNTTDSNSDNRLSPPTNDGYNYYYNRGEMRVLNVIYKPDYNYEKFVDNIKKEGVKG